MRWSTILLIILFFSNDCLSQEVQKISSEPVVQQPVKDSLRKNILITVDKGDKIYLGSNEIFPSMLDSVLKIKIDSLKTQTYTPFVVISADRSATYGAVYTIMTSAKRAGARVSVTVK
jgi:biopolymer transport protein ExbD